MPMLDSVHNIAVSEMVGVENNRVREDIDSIMNLAFGEWDDYIPNNVDKEAYNEETDDELM